jgi:hypothetical protein
MKGGLRWPFGPFQVSCVLVAVLLTAAFSSQRGFTGRVGTPTQDSCCTILGERSNASTTTVVPGNPNSTDLKIAEHLPVARDDGDDVSMPRRSGWRLFAPSATAAARGLRDLASGGRLCA